MYTSRQITFLPVNFTFDDFQAQIVEMTLIYNIMYARKNIV